MKLSTGLLITLLFVLLSVEPSAAQESGSPPPPDGAALSDSAYFNAYYSWVWDNHLYVDPDSAMALAVALEREAKVKDYKPGSALALNLQSVAAFISGDPSKAVQMGYRAAALQRSIGDLKGEAGTLGNVGVFFQRMGQYDSSLAVLHKAMDVQLLMKDTIGIANNLNAQGNVQLERGDLHRAVDTYHRALGLSEAYGDTGTMSISEGSLGNAYAMQKDFPQAITHFKRASELFRGSGDLANLQSSEGNIGAAYIESGDTTNGAPHLREAYMIAERMGNARAMALTLINLADLRGRYGDHLGAYTMLQLAERHAEKSGDTNARSQVLQNMGAALLGLGRVPEAVSVTEKALALGREVGLIVPQRDAAETLAKGYAQLGNWQKAMEAQLLFTQLRDSVMNEENQRAVLGYDLRRGFEKQSLADSLQHASATALQGKEIQKQKLMRNGFMGGFALVALFAGVFLFQRNRISKEKARSEELLLNILPEEVAEELKAKGSAEAVQIDQVTVLFTDFKGFTAMSEVLSPRDLVRDLNECFSAFDHITGKYGIEKIKTIGDAYMAAGGLPTPNTTHATDVINAAFEMRDFIAAGKAQKVAAGLPYFEIRIGVHTGPVVAGIVGVKKFSYDIWGDTVNTASRMESSGEVGQVNISETTYALVREQAGSRFKFTPRGKVQAKGKGEMEMYFVASA